MELDTHLSKERYSIHDELIKKQITMITNPRKSQYGFHFIGVNAEKNKQIYLNTFNNF